MKWALVEGRRIQALPGLTGTCPGCGGEVVAKCGELVQWHWAHRASECDPWSESESAWHLNWKSKFPAEWQERVIGDHRADVLTPRGVIEFQKSAISSGTIREREQFYGRMVWVVDASGFNLERSDSIHGNRFEKSNPLPPFDLLSGNNERFSRLLKLKSAYTSKMHQSEPHFRWLWPRKSWLAAKKTIFLDRGYEDLLQIKWVGSAGGLLICKRILKDDFVTAVTRR